MAAASQGPWLVRLGRKVVEVPSLRVLQKAVKRGKIGATTVVRAPGSGSWRRVEDVPALAAHLPDDPWAAWDDLDDLGDWGAAEVATEEGDGPAADAPADPAPGPDAAAAPDEDPEDPPTDVDEIVVQVDRGHQLSSPRTVDAVAPVVGMQTEEVEDVGGSALEVLAESPPAPDPAPAASDPAPAASDPAPAASDPAPAASAAPPATTAPRAPARGGSRPRRPAPPDRGRTPPPPPRTLPPPPQRGKVIEFPHATADTRPPVSGTAALNPAETIPLPRFDPSPRPARPAPAASAQAKGAATQVNWLRFGLIALAGVASLLLVRWFVTVNSQATFAPPGTEDQARATRNGPPVPTGRVAPTAEPRIGVTGAELPMAEVQRVDPYADVEDGLRDAMRDGMLDVEQPGDLGDALLIELRQVRLDIIKVDADVTSWAGRNKDVPESSLIRVRLRTSPDELERSLAGAALVVGKYLQHYNMEAEQFVVVFEGISDQAQQVRIQGDLARRFYLQRTDMQGLLDEMRGG